MEEPLQETQKEDWKESLSWLMWNLITGSSFDAIREIIFKAYDISFRITFTHRKI